MEDYGFVWHGLLQALFADQAPKPFVDRLDSGANELLGYSKTCTPQSGIEALALQATGIERMQSRTMPTNWQRGQMLSFEVRARPIVRSRQASTKGSAIELDAAVVARRDNKAITREAAYRNWLERELARGHAAELTSMRMAGFRRSRVARRCGPHGNRAWSSIEGPDAWLRGVLRIADANAFKALLERGLGRHRSFGFGCLLLAPPGVLE